MDTQRRNIKSYVIRAGRMSPLQREAYEKHYKKYSIEFGAELNINRIFGDPESLCIEIGFGMGTATAEIAEKNPDKAYLGIEVHTPGVGKLLSEIENRGLENLRIIKYDAVQVLKTMFSEESVGGFHIFFPDPWPKKKHNKRRLINDDFTKLLVSRLKKGGYIYTATDWEDYAEQMFEVFERNPELENSFEKWAENISWRPETGFERKGLNKNHLIKELYYIRV